MATEVDNGLHEEVCPAPAPAASSVETDCSRWAKRRASHALVTIQSPDLPRGVTCTMRNSSSTGALIECVGGDQGEAFARLPDQFTLYLPMERVSIECRLVWRQFRQIGVQYTAPARVLAKPATPTRMIQQPARKGLLARATAKVKR